MSAASLPAALTLAEEYGLPVFPCRSRDEVINGEKRKAKSPLTPHGFEDASTSILCIEQWFEQTPDALIGVPTGTASKLFVVDIDPEGADWYQQNAERLACGRIHKTRRGWHLLYRMPATTLGNTTGALAQGVDTRGVGGYVIWWPAHGLEAMGDLEGLTEPPTWLIEALKRPSTVNRAQQGNGGRKYGEGERHGALLRFASSLRHKALSGTPFEAALLAWNLENCEPPQDEADVLRIARDYAEKPEDADVAQARLDAGSTQFNTLNTINTAEYKSPPPVVADLLYAGAWLLSGRPKIGKSWWLLQLALAVAEADTFLGFACPVVDAEVLYIASEDTDARIQGRLHALGVAQAPDTVHLVNQHKLFEIADRFANTLTFAQFLESWLDRHPKVTTVLIDTEATVRQVWAGERKTEALTARIVETDYKQTRGFDAIALRRQIVIILVNHASKRKSGEWIDPHETINRSNTSLAGVSGSMTLVDPPDADPFDTKAKTRVFAVRGRDLKDELLLAIHQREDMPYFVKDGIYSEVRQTQVEAELMEALEELMPETPAGKYVTANELAESTGKTRGTVQRAITRMVAKGRTRWKKCRLTAKRGKGGGVRLDPIEP
jgi:hypothetical protein